MSELAGEDPRHRTRAAARAGTWTAGAGSASIPGPVLIGRVQGVGLEPAEAEIQPRLAHHRSRKVVAARIALFRESGDVGTAGIGLPQHFRGFVKGFPRGVIQGFSQQAVDADTVYPHQLCMTAGYQQRDEGVIRVTVFQHRRQQVALHMVHTQYRHSPSPGKRLRQGGAHHGGADQAGARGVGDAVHFCAADACLGQHLIEQRQRLAHVVPRGELGHHATVFAVDLDLTVEGVRQ